MGGMTDTDTSRAITAFTGAYEFLSNFHQGHPFRIDGQPYATVEHAFQAAKFTDPKVAAHVAEAPTPGGAKQRGRKNRMDKARARDWANGLSEMAMRGALYAKFSQNPSLARKLVETGDAELIEGNRHHDNLWGDCRCDRPTCQLPGQNLLGKHLMAVRRDLRAVREAPAAERITPIDVMESPRDQRRIEQAEYERDHGGPDDADIAEDMNDAAILGRGL